MPGSLLADTDAPTPLPQINTPRSAALVQHGSTDRLGEVRIIHRRVAIGAFVDHFMSQAAQILGDDLLQIEAGMVRADDDAHFYFPNSAVARSTTWLTVNPYFSITTFPGADAPNRSTPMMSPPSPT